MLKVCWDCIAGDQQRRTDDPYSVHLNGTGGAQGPPWQSISNGNMFPMPTLRARNEIIIMGQMTTDRRLNIALATSDSTMCQIDVTNRPNESEDVLEISSYGDNVHQSEASSWFNNGTQYLFRFLVNNNERFIDIFVGVEENEADQYLASVAIDVNNLKMISVNGEVKKLSFIFK